MIDLETADYYHGQDNPQLPPLESLVDPGQMTIDELIDSETADYYRNNPQMPPLDKLDRAEYEQLKIDGLSLSDEDLLDLEDDDPSLER